MHGQNHIKFKILSFANYNRYIHNEELPVPYFCSLNETSTPSALINLYCPTFNCRLAEIVGELYVTIHCYGQYASIFVVALRPDSGSWPAIMGLCDHTHWTHHSR